MSSSNHNNATEKINPAASNSGHASAAPPIADIIARVTKTAARWTGGIVGGVLILGVGHAFLPPGMDPVHLIGGTLGAIYSEESDAQRKAAAETARQMALAQARAAAEVQALKESMQGQIDTGIVSDWMCAASQMFGSGRSDYADLRDGLRSACRVSEANRERMMEQFRRNTQGAR